MVRARTLSCLVVLSASLAVLSLPAPAAAQCCCGSRGSSARMGPGGLLTQMQQKMMQQQMMMQMQMQTQQMMQQQSQQMQMQKLVNSKMVDLMQQMSNKDSSELKIALEDAQPEIRWAAARTIGQKRLPLQEALIEHITDPNGDVRQAARGALIQLSSAPASGKSSKSRSVDFGPAPNATRSATATAARKWSEWWAKQAPVESGSRSDRTSVRASR